MAHGRPTGYETLYDQNGNPVSVKLDRDLNYSLSVSDERLEKLVSLAALQNALLRAVLFQLSLISGEHVNEDTFLEE